MSQVSPPNSGGKGEVEVVKKGDRVRMTRQALSQKLDGPKSKRCGIVVGESRDGKRIYVRRDGDMSRTEWHRDFWETDCQMQNAAEKGDL